ncbi:MAG: hypothetical protein LBM23_00625 [Propionibacteriaceae bacterium]|jgi:hypothetical protein|nr:hypothetical protein [Propionibacteriaceae bacterium]
MKRRIRHALTAAAVLPLVLALTPGAANAAPLPTATPITYDGVPVGQTWYDTDGDSIQAHGGGFLQEGDTYYWVGEDKAHNSSNFLAVHLYSSKDLLNWTDEGQILTAASPTVAGAEHGLTDCKIERPKLVKNPDGGYVLWGHWEDMTGYSSSQIMVATSDSITGPYTFQGHWRPGALDDPQYRNWRVSGSNYISDAAYAAGRSADLTGDIVSDTSRYGFGSRDLTVYAEGDTAYLLSSEDHATMRLHQLTTDFDDVALANGAPVLSYQLFVDQRREAPALVKVDGVYYAITSSQSGWYPNQAMYATATDITDPASWSALQVIGNNSTYYSQPTNIMTIAGESGNSYVYMGDRWNSKALGSSSYVWMPLSINSGARTMDMTFAPGWSLDVATGSIVMPETALVSENQPVYATATSLTNGDGTRLAPELANDGNDVLNSFWDSNKEYYGQDTVPYTWTVDLGQAHDLARIDLSFAVCNGSEGRYTYRAWGSNSPISSLASANSAAWTLLADRSGNTEVAFTSDEIVGLFRYVRVEVLNVVNDHNGNSTASWANGIVEIAVHAATGEVDPNQVVAPASSRLSYAVHIGSGASALPATVAMTTRSGATVQAPVSWDVPTGAFATSYAMVTVTGTVQGYSRPVTAVVEVVPDDLVYFIDSGMAGLTSEPYNAVAALADLRNNAPDQQASGGSWGGNLNQVTVKGNSGDQLLDKQQTGLYTDKTTPITYTLPLDAGTYSFSAGFREWWTGPRTMNITLTYVDSRGRTVTEQLNDSVIRTGSSSSYPSDVVFTSDPVTMRAGTATFNVVYGDASDAPVISWLAVNGG